MAIPNWTIVAYVKSSTHFLSFIQMLTFLPIKVAQSKIISVRNLDSNAHFSAGHHANTRGVARKCARFQVCKTHNKHGGPRLSSSSKYCHQNCLVEMVYFNVELTSPPSHLLPFNRINIIMAEVTLSLTVPST